MWMVIFLVLPLAGLAYVFWHLWCLLPVANMVKTIVIAVCLTAFATLFLNFSHAIERMPLKLAQATYEVGNSSIFILLYLVMLFLLLDIGRMVHLVPRQWLYANWHTTAVLIVAMCGIFVYGYANYMHKEREPIDLNTEKAMSKEVKMVMMSDMHLGYHNRKSELAKWVDKVNAERPDFVLIAGDMVDISLRPLIEENMAEELRRIEAPVYACFGNHEYYSGAEASADFYKKAGITLLRDSAAVVGDVVIIGRDDRTNPHRKSIGALTKGIDTTKYVILLDHQPYHLEQAERAGVDFQFSGHTHKGQVWPISLITESVYENAYGPWQRGKTRYYISSGMGIWGGKFRIGTSSEYVVGRIFNN